METKLESVLRNFSEANNEDKKPKSYRKDVLLRHALFRAGGHLASAAAAAPFNPALAFALSVTAPIGAAGALLEGSTELNSSQRALDSIPRETLPKYDLYKSLSHAKFTKVSPYGLDKYLPSKEVNKLNEDYRRALEEYPLNKAEKKTEEYKKNKAARQALKSRLIEDKTDLFLDTNRIGKPLKPKINSN